MTANKGIQTTNTEKATTPIFDPTAFLVGHAKNMTESKQLGKSITYVTSQDGQVYEVRKNRVGTFMVKAKKVLGQVEQLQEGFSLDVPKIPFNQFLQIVTFFRDVADVFDEDEAMVQLFFDTVNEEYILHCIEQTTTKTNVHFKRSKELETDDTKILVMDIHSHNTMGAFFSATDDSSEKETRVYGVVGKVKDEIPECKFRYSVAGDFREINMFDVIEAPTMNIDFGNGVTHDISVSEKNLVFPKIDYPNDWMDIIEEGKKKRNEFLSNRTKVRWDTEKDSFNTYSSQVGKSRPFGLSTPASQMSIFDNKRSTYNGHHSLSHLADEDGVIRHIDDSDFDPTTFGFDYEDEISGSGLGLGSDTESRIEEVLEVVGDLTVGEFKFLLQELIQHGYDIQMIEQLKDNNLLR